MFTVSFWELFFFENLIFLSNVILQHVFLTLNPSSTGMKNVWCPSLLKISCFPVDIIR